MEALGINLCWTSVGTVKLDKGTSAIQMFYQDRTIFVSPRTNRNYFPAWHEIAHAVVGRDHLDEPNYGLEGAEQEYSDMVEYDTQAVQVWLMDQYLGAPKKTALTMNLFGFGAEEDRAEALERGHEVLVEKLPELFE